MLYLKKKEHMKTERKLFFLVLIFLVIVFITRICGGEIKPVKDDGLIIRLSKQYKMGKIYDRNKEIIAQGKGNKVDWKVKEDSRESLNPLFNPDLSETFVSRMTIWGMAPELFGYSDERLNLEGLFHPGKERTGGNVQLTIDQRLQTYIYNLLKRNGYDTANVVVSNWKTGEMLAAVSLCSSSKEKEIDNVLSERYSPGSTMKIILAAAALNIDPELENFTYDCSAQNHVFHTKEGDYKINCSGDVYHGIVGMKDAIAYSCNGYFVSLIQQLPKEKLKQQLEKWGFDTTIKFDQFSYWDQSFTGEKNNEGISESEYLFSSIGQGNCTITPVGMNLCTNVLLNSGRLQEPKFVLAKSDSSNEKMENQLDGKNYKVSSTKAAEKVREMMLGVTSYGTGKDFYMPGFAAKTGTAQKTNKIGKISDLYTVWTTGGLVSEETPYSITVNLDDVHVSSTDAGKIAKEILQCIVG